MTEHRFIGSDATPNHHRVREIALVLANYYAGVDFSRSRWKQAKEHNEAPVTVEWYTINNDGRGNQVAGEIQVSEPFSLFMFEGQMLADQKFSNAKFKLPAPTCDWLDASTRITPGFHAPSNESKSAITFIAPTQLGPRFPIRPAIDREGTVISSVHDSMLGTIAKYRRQLIEQSAEPARPEYAESIHGLVSATISLLEGVLHLFYFKSKYSPLPNWPEFDEGKFGTRYARRLMDKLQWVGMATGVPLHLSDTKKKSLKKSLESIKNLRNHLQHFDPPAFCYTMEDVCVWINQCSDVVEILWHIRRCAQALPSLSLIESLIEPRVVFVPKDPTRKRVPQPKHVGYASTAEMRLDAPPHVFGDEGILISRLPCDPNIVSRKWNK